MYATKIPSDERSLVLRLIEGEEDAFCGFFVKFGGTSSIVNK